MGAPTSYKPEYADIAYKLRVEKKYTQRELASHLDVSISTIKAWAKKYPEFKSAVREADEELIRQVENAVLSRATGLEVSETRKITRELDENGVESVVTTTVRQLPSDTAAAKFVLTNLTKGKWKDKQEHQVDFEVLNVVGMAPIKTEEGTNEQ